MLNTKLKSIFMFRFV